VSGVSIQGAGGARYRFDWTGEAARLKVAEAVLRDMESFAALLEGYLRATLHRVTGDMADKAFARVEVRGNLIVIVAGSESDHTIFHELRYHPQLRQTMDQWAPRIAAGIAATVRRG
jgi:hypothetical protein